MRLDDGTSKAKGSYSSTCVNSNMNKIQKFIEKQNMCDCCTGCRVCSILMRQSDI